MGYGDIAVDTPGARLFACFHILLSVSWLLSLFSDISTLSKTRKSQLERASLLTRKFDHDELMALDRENGDGVDKLEFVVGSESLAIRLLL